jgi:superoxide dismutase, Fe-Mn family
MPQMTRRQLLQTAGAGAAVLALSPLAGRAADDMMLKYPYKVPKLPYPYDALDKYIDEKTMHLHHDKHHQAYVDNLNKALKDHPNQQKKTIEELLRGIDQVPVAIRTAVRNHGGGHLNHTMLWENMSPRGGGKPNGELAQAINSTFKSFTNFQKQLSTAAIGQFGSGWGWLVLGKNGKLMILPTPNQDCPLMAGHTPLLGVDVWEHAYYLKYQNLRPKYVEACWHVVNWEKVGERYAAAKKANG